MDLNTFVRDYAGVIFVALIAIFGLIYYFATADYSRPEQCSFDRGLSCLEFNVSFTSMNVMLQNSMAYDVIVSRLYDYSGECSAPGKILKSGDIASFNLINCTHYNGQLNLGLEIAGEPNNITINGNIYKKFATPKAPVNATNATG